MRAILHCRVWIFRVICVVAVSECNGVCDADKIFAGTLDVEAINIEKESYTIIETSTIIVDAIKDNAFREFLIETYAG